MVYYQHQDKKAWLGPAKVFASNGNDIFIFVNGNIRKVPWYNVQLCYKEVEIDKNKGEKNEAREQFEEQGFGDNIEDMVVDVVDMRVSRSVTDAKKKRWEQRKNQYFGWNWKMHNVLMKWLYRQ